MHSFLKVILRMKLYVLQTVPLSIIRSFSLYTQQWYMSYWKFHKWVTFIHLWNFQYDIYHCYVYNKKLLIMDRETVHNT